MSAALYKATPVFPEPLTAPNIVSCDLCHPLAAVFIRAPYIERCGPDVSVLADVNGKIVIAKQEKILVTAFHPELTNDDRVHRYFLRMAAGEA